MIVVMEPGFERLVSVLGGLIGEAVGPFPECGLDEPLGLAIGAGAVGFGEGVLQPIGPADYLHRMGVVELAVVGEDAS